MKKTIILTLLLILSLLGGCAKEMPYEIVEEAESVYLVLDGIEPNEDESGYLVQPAVGFDSIEEMISDINTGSFTESELSKIAQFSKDDDGRIQICDISNLYEAVYPSTYTDYNITWTGDSYSYALGCEEWEVYDNFLFITKDYFDQQIDWCSNFDERTTLSEVSESTVSDRNASVFIFTTVVGEEKKNVYYSIAGDEKTLHVWEHYDTVSSTVPHLVEIYGTEQNCYFKVNVTSVDERPSVEWLSQFGIREYVETSTS